MPDHIKSFANNIVQILRDDPQVVGVTAGGSWLNNQLDEYSDLDIIIVTEEQISNRPELMEEYAHRFGNLLHGFTGEHVGDKRLLICLYDDPLLHVDLKFLVLKEFEDRVEDPAILLDTNGRLEQVIKNTKAEFPYPNYQWLEDRFWIWVHYCLLKIGRGELLEAMDVVHYFNVSVVGPFLQIKNRALPRGVRKAEFDLPKEDLDRILGNIPSHNKLSIIECLEGAVANYQNLRKAIFPEGIVYREKVEKRVLQYLNEIKNQ